MADAEQQESTKGSSRRQALKAGVAAGIGLAAWSGPTITSIGGTPAYAQTCTNFTVNQTDSDRNTDQSAGCANAGGTLRYKPPTLTLPAGYAFVPGWFPAAGHCNDQPYNLSLTFPAGITCRVTIRVHEVGLFNSGPWYYNNTFGPSASPLAFSAPATSSYSTTTGINSNTRWSVRVQCTNVAGCF